jgi:aspartate ammonia-lyase
LQLNPFEPVIALNIFQSIRIMAHAMTALSERCIKGITANEDHCRNLVTKSVGVVTALNTVIGYENTTRIARKAQAMGRGVAELVLEEGLLSPAQLADILLPENMIRPRRIAPLGSN